MKLELALITARGGSKGLPGKNVRMLGGRPLIAWTVTAALEAGLFARIVVSTDDADIADAARAAGAEVPFVRPAELATDAASSADVVRHALAACGTVGSFALLQPTSPFRDARHIKEAAALFTGRRASAVVGTVRAKPLAWTYLQSGDGSITPAVNTVEVTRRQDAGSLVQPNGSLYLTDTAQFDRSRSLIPAGALSYPMGLIASIDIDGIEDFHLAEAVVASGVLEATR